MEGGPPRPSGRPRPRLHPLHSAAVQSAMAPPRCPLPSLPLPLLLLLLVSLCLSLLSPVVLCASPGLELSELVLVRPSSLSLLPPFASDVLSYALCSPTLLSSLTVRASAVSPSSSLQLRLNDGPFVSASSDAEEVELLEGINHLFVQVLHEDAQTARDELLTYLITICNGIDCHRQSEAATPLAHLASLRLPQVNLTPTFSPDVFAYAGLTTRHTHGAVVVAELLHADGGQLLVASMNGDTFTSISSTRRSHAMPMRMGPNVLFVQVRDAASQLCTYSLRIERSADMAGHEALGAEERLDEIEYIGGFAYIRIKEASADLLSFVTSVGQLSPRFSPSVRRYSLVVDYHAPSVQLTVKPKDRDASMLAFYTSSLSSSPAPVALALTRDVPTSAIPLCVGTTTIRVQLTSYDGQLQDSYSLIVTRASEADEGDGVTAELSPSPAAPSRPLPHRVKPVVSAHADPTLLGVRGQSYEVHVEVGQVYNLLTEPHLLINARFVNIDALNSDASREGADAVIGIGEIGVLTRTGHRLHIETGTGEAGAGFSRVALNDQLMNVEDQAYIDNAEEGEHEGDAAGSAELLAFNSSTTFTLITPSWYIALLDTRGGLIPRISLTSTLELGAHGLIGQTWRAKREGRLHAHDSERGQGRGGVGLSTEGVEDSMDVLEGSMEDYRIRDQQLFSTHFMFSSYEAEGHSAST